tara:strand:- start:1008 stop:1295 length:288 start_codon:yes stop_codon:yes gene_type:complete
MIADDPGYDPGSAAQGQDNQQNNIGTCLQLELCKQIFNPNYPVQSNPDETWQDSPGLWLCCAGDENRGEGCFGKVNQLVVDCCLESDLADWRCCL